MIGKTILIGLGISALVLLAVFTPAAMAAYPEKPINMYIVFTAGGPMDSCTRALCTIAEKILGQPIVMINKAGGGGALGLSVIATDKPDGYSLCAGSSTGIMRIPITRKVTYKPLASFTNIYGYATVASGIQVRPDSPFKSYKEIVEYARQNPGKLKYATSGVGTPLHQGMLILEKKENIKMTHIPYEGAAEEFTAVLGGHVDLAHTGLTYSKQGQLRPLLTCTKERMKNHFPDTPTFIEAGYNFYNDSMFAMFGPAGMDPAIVKKLEDAFEKAVDSPEYQKVIDSLTMIYNRMRGAELTKFLENGWNEEIERLKSFDMLKMIATPPR